MSDPSGPDPLATALGAPHDSPTMALPGDEGPELREGRFERPPLAPGCPVRALGLTADISGTQRCFYLDVNGQLVGLEAGTRHGKNSLIALFGERSAWLEVNYPQWSKPITEYDRSTKTHTIIRQAEIVGFDQADASRALIEECTRRGVFDPTGRLRGRGAHSMPAGGMVVHYGDALLMAERAVDGRIKGWRWHECGLVEGHVYATGEAMPRPWPDAAPPRPAEQLLKLLLTWRWKRPKLDARFLLGWIGASMVGGALKWRPNIWITGGQGSGKSTLNGEQGVLDYLFGAGVVRTGNASAAAIRQTLKNSTVPVLFDEIEASADNRRVTEVVELARVSSSGATIHRGGADHTAHEFTLRSCFQFSSINIPPLQPQDRSRLCILELKPFLAGDKPPTLHDWGLADIGRQLQRRMIDGWERFEATYNAFADALTIRGHSRRGADQFGTLLACADILLNDALADDEEIAEWAALCAPDGMNEISEATADHEACLLHMLTHMVQSRGGDERETVGAWIGRAIGTPDAPLFAEESAQMAKAADRLQQLGLKLVNARWHAPQRTAGGEIRRAGRWGAETFSSTVPGWLAVAGSHQALSELFAGTTWQDGVWRQSLARTPGALESVTVKFGKISQRAVLLPLASVIDESEVPRASKLEAAAEWMATQSDDPY